MFTESPLSSLTASNGLCNVKIHNKSAVLGPLGIDVHDGAGDAGNHGGDRYGNLSRQVGSCGGQGNGGGSIFFLKNSLKFSLVTPT